MQLINGNGTFASVDTITIRFKGTLNFSSDQNLDLDIQAIVTALNAKTSDSESN